MAKKILEEKQKEPEEPTHLKLILKRHTSGSKRNPTIDYYLVNIDRLKSSPQYDVCIDDDEFLGIITPLINYLSSFKDKPILSLEYDNFSRKESDLIKVVFNLYKNR